jgi:hypothetical protein
MHPWEGFKWGGLQMNNEVELVARAIQQAAHPRLKWEEFDDATHALWLREAAAAIDALDQVRSGKALNQEKAPLSSSAPHHPVTPTRNPSLADG